MSFPDTFPNSSWSLPEAAVWYRQNLRAWFIFPLRAQGKTPRFTGWQRWAMESRVEDVEEMWRQRNLLNIGMRTGIGGGGSSADWPMCWVLDLDLPKGGQPGGVGSLAKLEAEHGELPVTLAQQTQSGGIQMFFLMPPFDVHGKPALLGPGLDVRGKGNLAVLPPSEGEKGRYRWLNWMPPVRAPQWLEELVRKPEVKPRKPVAHRKFSGSILHPWVWGALDGELKRLREAPEGTRNDQLNRAAYSLARLAAGGWLPEEQTQDQLEEVATEIGLASTEARRSIKSGWNAGWQNPMNPPE